LPTRGYLTWCGRSLCSCEGRRHDRTRGTRRRVGATGSGPAGGAQGRRAGRAERSAEGSRDCPAGGWPGQQGSDGAAPRGPGVETGAGGVAERRDQPGQEIPRPRRDPGTPGGAVGGAGGAVTASEVTSVSTRLFSALSGKKVGGCSDILAFPAVVVHTSDGKPQ